MKFPQTLCGVLLAVSVAGAFAQSASAPAAGGAAPYKVVDGNKVDPATMEGFRTWRAAACDRCHGANQEGLVGPSLVASLKTLSKDEFVKTVMNGRPNTQMVAFSGNATVTKNIDALYAYLKGRSDGAITSARVEPMK
ncbi:MAG TPA: cytochrome c [Burkholderiaceae bacterium]|nr:cytochrome c [Burkholderiaceae bacterium]